MIANERASISFEADLSHCHLQLKRQIQKMHNNVRGFINT